MPALSLDEWVVRSTGLIAARTGEGTVLLDVSEGKYFILNETAEAIWARLAVPIQLTALRDSIAAEFDIAPAEAAAAILELVAQFRDQNIVALGRGASVAEGDGNDIHTIRAAGKRESDSG